MIKFIFKYLWINGDFLLKLTAWLIPALLMLTACSTKEVRPVDQQKSCEALKYEYEQSQSVIMDSVPEKETAAIHYIVVGSGVALSLTPALLLGKYFYGVPALTIAYYNFFMADNQEAEHQEKVRQRLEVIKVLMENKNCTKGDH